MVKKPNTIARLNDWHFLILGHAGDIQFDGYIINEIKPDYYLAQFGGPGAHKRIMSLDDLRGVLLFRTKEELGVWAAHYQAGRQKAANEAQLKAPSMP